MVSPLWRWFFFWPSPVSFLECLRWVRSSVIDQFLYVDDDDDGDGADNDGGDDDGGDDEVVKDTVTSMNDSEALARSTSRTTKKTTTFSW